MGWFSRLFRRRVAQPPKLDLATAPDPRPCDCMCHKNPLIMHVAPCCLRCPKCGVSYPRMEYPVHEHRCTR